MTKDEARFYLRALRPDGRDASDPFFADALAAARNDQDLAAWLSREQATDASIARKLSTIAPPADLEQSILSGVRASRSASRFRRVIPLRPILALAAVLTLAAIVAHRLLQPKVFDFDQFAALAMSDLEGAHNDHRVSTPEIGLLQARLSATPFPLPANLRIDLDQLSRHGCRVVNIGGQQVYEICFFREGAWFHLYATKLDSQKTKDRPDALTPAFYSRREFASATWSDRNAVYTLVAQADVLPAAFQSASAL